MPSEGECESPAENTASAVVGLARNESTPVQQKVALCAFCQKLPAVCKVERLRIRAGDSEDFVKVRLPYCGTC